MQGAKDIYPARVDPAIEFGPLLVAAHDQFEQVLGGGVRQLAHAEVVDDEQGYAGQFGEVVLAGVGERGLCELFKESVRFAVDDAVALLDGGPADGLGEVALTGSGRTEQEGVLALGDEACGGELVDECAVDVLVEGEIEAVERAVGVTEARQTSSDGRLGDLPQRSPRARGDMTPVTGGCFPSRAYRPPTGATSPQLLPSVAWRRHALTSGTGGKALP